jgi:hypothetical protein
MFKEVPVKILALGFLNIQRSIIRKKIRLMASSAVANQNNKAKNHYQKKATEGIKVLLSHPSLTRKETLLLKFRLISKLL